MACISLNKLDINKDMRFIVFNISQTFFKKDRYMSIDAFVLHLKRKYDIEYNYRILKNVLNEIAEDGFLKHYSDKYALDELEL